MTYIIQLLINMVIFKKIYEYQYASSSELFITQTVFPGPSYLLSPTFMPSLSKQKQKQTNKTTASQKFPHIMI